MRKASRTYNATFLAGIHHTQYGTSALLPLTTYPLSPPNSLPPSLPPTYKTKALRLPGLQNFPSLRMSAAIDLPVYARMWIIVNMYHSLYHWWGHVALGS